MFLNTVSLLASELEMNYVTCAVRNTFVYVIWIMMMMMIIIKLTN